MNVQIIGHKCVSGLLLCIRIIWSDYMISSNEKILKELSNISEFQNDRKATGSFYTPSDLADYVVINSFVHYMYPNLSNVYSIESGIKKICSDKSKCLKLIFETKIFDPTAGAGELLLSSIKIKLILLSKIKDNYKNADLLKIYKTIFGNDYNELAVKTMKDRLLLFIRDYTTDEKVYYELQCIISKNLTCKDYIEGSYLDGTKFDIIVGNPPYVEDNKYKGILNRKYGNVYCNIIENCFENIKKYGTIVLIMPISYVSTPRMNKIRNVVMKKRCKQIILNYADRPDCLFTNVHQKLNIVIFKLSKNGVYTSGYKYWSKKERQNIFSDVKTISNKYINEEFIPKLANNTETSIYKKVISNDNDFYRIQCKTNKSRKIYLNMRAAFWIKCFMNPMESNEYKEFSISSDNLYLIYCILNSSLFFWFWNIVSDCWHITNKDLKNFKFVFNNFDANKVKKLALDLSRELERTKKYVGTKQTIYEYKHKLCKKQIDKIDDYLKELYNLSNNELDYIKNYSIKYRMSDANE